MSIIFHFRAAIFDLDGTLLNTLPGIQTSANLMLDDYELPNVGPAEIRRFVGDGATMLVKRLLEHANGEKVPVPEALERYLFHFHKHCLDGIAPYPGIPELLDFLRSLDIPAAVCTNKPQDLAEINIHACFPENSFRHILGDSPDHPKKPAPDGALRLAQAMKATPAQCLYIGDTNTDMRTGQAAGMFTVGAAWGFRDRNELAAFHPDYLVDTPNQLLDYLAKTIQDEN